MKFPLFEPGQIVATPGALDALLRIVATTTRLDSSPSMYLTTS